MQPSAGQEFHLLDAQLRSLGQVMIERRADQLLFGQFVAAPAFATVVHLFRDFEEAVNLQALSVVDELDRAITALGLHLRSTDGSQSLAIHDVQIWSGGRMSCRLGSPTPAAVNGSPDRAHSAQPIRE